MWSSVIQHGRLIGKRNKAKTLVDFQDIDDRIDKIYGKGEYYGKDE